VRLGRALYLAGRGDSPNNLQCNGEQWLIQQIFAIAQDEEKIIVFDIGANVGAWSLAVLDEARKKSYPKERLALHSFEPCLSTMEVLKERISMHPYRTAATVVPVAMSDSEGVADLYVAGETAGTNSLHNNESGRNLRTVVVRKQTIQGYCKANAFELPQFIKCDTEGHDFAVISGARSLFEIEAIRVFQFEYNHRWIYSRHYLKDVFAFLLGTPYQVGKLSPHQVEVYDHWHPELERFFEGNYVIVHPEFLSRLPATVGSVGEHNVYVTSCRVSYMAAMERRSLPKVQS
jgi:FkbM family methyltransferase